MRLFRVFPFNAQAPAGAPGHPLFVPRALQGAGRHDNPDLYGVFYLSERPAAAVAEHLAHLRGQVLEDSDLERNGLRLFLAALEVRTEKSLQDLDEPRTLVRLRLRPSEVATRDRTVTQRWAARVYRTHRGARGIRWWSTLEASLLHVTLFDRAVPHVRMESAPERLGTGHPAVREAAELLGLEARA